ncbi:ethanolamine kinase 1-like isoform X4 [Ptychodera flava]|uniref:ethanolamine kinase 1-like isoform X4 n=1 Tax=Ptychodera flava TaxID=63121 RepID=UPI003969E0FD
MALSGVGVKRIDITVDENEAEPGALELMKIVRPEWKAENIQFKMLTGGNTNKMYACYVPEIPGDTVLIRIYGHKSELMVDRAKEIETFQVLFKAKCGPELYCCFNNGICYQYIPGVTIDSDMVKSEKVYPLVAHKMAQMHTIKPEDGSQISNPGLFPTMKRWYQNFPKDFEDEETNIRFKENIPNYDQLGKELEELETTLVQLNSPIVFCHNDLLLANIVYDEQTNVAFIDYEYTCYNYQGFDIANHFCEFAGLDVVDFDNYPQKEFQLKWIKKYLSDWYTMSGVNKYVTDKDVEKLYVVVNKFALAAHFFWGLWTLIQSVHSTVDFDFLGYGIQKFGEYFRRKEEFLALQMPSD